MKGKSSDDASLDTLKFIIESDATVVAPLVFACLLGWHLAALLKPFGRTRQG
jgi:hypothetical protein